MIQDKIILITGASKGLGKAMAITAAQRGASLALCSRNYTELIALKAALKTDYGSECLIIKTDVRDEKAVKESISKTIKHFGNLDVIIANAGISRKAPLFELTTNDWEDVMNTNAKSVFYYLKYGYQHMNKGKIIVISSLSSWIFLKYYSLYAASKSAVDSLVTGFNKDTKKPIKAISLHPARLKTDISKETKYKSSTIGQIDPLLYAEYVMERIEDNILKAIWLFIRNWLIRLVYLNNR